MQHHFDTKVAEEYGIVEAILINHFEFWIAKNEANDVNFHDGYYWTYNSRKALAKLFPYLTERKIGYALDHLVNANILQTGNYNASAYDRTLWYAFTDYGVSILQNCKMGETNLGNGNAEIVEPIPDNNTYIIPDNNTYIINQVVDYMNQVLGTNYRPNARYLIKLIKARINEGATEEDFKRVINVKAEEWRGTDFEKFLRPQTLFGTKFESYLNQPRKTASTGNPFLDMLQRGDY